MPLPGTFLALCALRRLSFSLAWGHAFFLLADSPSGHLVWKKQMYLLNGRTKEWRRCAGGS